MKHLSRDSDARQIAAMAMLSPNVWDTAHLKSITETLRACFVIRMSGFERTHGEGSYSRLLFAFEYARWRLEHEGVIHPSDLEIVEAYTSLPYRSGTGRDDGIDFETPRRRLTTALAAPLVRPAFD